MNLETLYKKKRKIFLSERKINSQLQKTKLRDNFLLRKERDHHLLMLGILMEKVSIDTTPIETLTGFFLDFKNVSIIQKEQLKTSGSLLLSKKDKLRETEILYMTVLERKARAHRLIGIGALLEIPNIDKKDPSLLIGYFNELHKTSEIQRQRYLEIGTTTLIERNNNYKRR